MHSNEQLNRTDLQNKRIADNPDYVASGKVLQTIASVRVNVEDPAKPSIGKNHLKKAILTVGIKNMSLLNEYQPFTLSYEQALHFFTNEYD